MITQLLEEQKVFTSEIVKTSQDEVEETNDKEVIEYCNNLMFKNSINSERAKSSEREKLDRQHRINNAQFILEFKVKYPESILISQTKLQWLCDKYDLWVRGTDRFLGEVPDDILEKISDLRFRQEEKNLMTGLYIAAPSKLLKEKGIKIEWTQRPKNLDPIILSVLNLPHSVENKMFAILAAWGPEEKYLITEGLI